jgi:uncharacterized cupin superfamily protein
VADPRRRVSNVFHDDWEELYPPAEGWRSNTRRLAPGQTLGVSVYELLPGQAQCPYHFHHGNEECVLVYSGRPTLRTPDGETTLEPGDVAHFTRGAEGAHQLLNRTEEPVRYVIVDAKVSPELVQYPDSGKIAAMSRETQLYSIHRLDDAVDYFDGEQPRV